MLAAGPTDPGRTENPVPQSARILVMTGRQPTLDRDDPGMAAADRREWQQRRAWLADVHFADGPTERLVDRDPLPMPDRGRPVQLLGQAGG